MFIFTSVWLVSGQGNSYAVSSRSTHFFRFSVLIFIQHFCLLHYIPVRWVHALGCVKLCCAVLCFMIPFSRRNNLITFNLHSLKTIAATYHLWKNEMAIIGLSIFWQLNNELHHVIYMALALSYEAHTVKLFFDLQQSEERMCFPYCKLCSIKSSKWLSLRCTRL